MNVSDLASPAGPLRGVRVLELATVVAVPYAGRVLGDFGAEIVKVEDPNRGGDPSRQLSPMKNGLSLMFARMNVGKQSVAVDLRTEAGRDVIRRLVKDFDVVLVNFRSDTVADWGLTYDDLAAVNPQIVYAHLTGFGKTGGNAARPGFGTIMEGLTGYAFVNGWPDRPPTTAPFGMTDQTAGLAVAFGVAMALYQRQVTGRGLDLDVALYEPLLSMLADPVLRYSALGTVAQRRGNSDGAAAPRGIYRTGDERWVVLSGSSPNSARACIQAVGLDPDDERWIDNPSRIANQVELDDVIANWTCVRTREEVLAVMEAAGVPAGPINSAADIVDEPMFRERGSIVALNTPELGDVVIPGRIFRVGGLGELCPQAPPGLGQHTDSVLSGAGFSDDEIADLRRAGAVA